MKNINKRTLRIATGIVILTLSICLIIMIFAFNNTNKEYEAKIDIIQHDNDKALAVANKQSDIEILGSKADYARQDAEKYISDINEAKELIKTLEPKYEQSLLRVKCNKSQIDRMINGLEYNLDFCSNKDNLESFRTIKK